MIKFEFSNVRELKQFMALFCHGNEARLEEVINELDKATNSLGEALDKNHQEGEKDGN